MLTREEINRPRPMPVPKDRKMTRVELRHWQAANDAIMRTHMMFFGEDVMALHTPYEWQQLEQDFRTQGKKQRITLLLDASVVRFFRLKGRGYQAFINEVLRCYSELRLSKLIEGLEDRGPNDEPL